MSGQLTQNSCERKIGFDSSSLVEQNNSVKFPWILRRDLGYWIESKRLGIEVDYFNRFYSGLLKYWSFDANKKKITTKKGLRTDFASIPRFIWVILSSTDIRRPALQHDAQCRDLSWLYRFGWVCRKDAVRYKKIFDLVFLESMTYTEPRIPEWKRKGAYYGVRLGGKI